MAGAKQRALVLLNISIFITYLSSTQANEAFSKYSYFEDNSFENVQVETIQHHDRARREAVPTQTTTVRSMTAGTSTSTPPSTSPSTLPSQTTMPTTTTQRPLDKNTTIGGVDDKAYYYSKYTDDAEVFRKYWVDLESMRDQRVHHETLSEAHQTAARIYLTSTFIFYGHRITQVTIATGGFIYMSDFLHQRLTATQYVAPLMANYDTRIQSEESNIYYFHNDTMLVVHWDKVVLKDNPNAGSFTFQLLLKNSGEIFFVYKEIPVNVPTISAANHPVKVGVSDAYYVDRLEPNSGMTFRTIYEYDRLQLDSSKVKANSVYMLYPLATCNNQSTCEACTSANIPQFTCNWCQKIRKCSDGMDRHRQSWLGNGCQLNKKNIKCSDLDAVTAASKGIDDGSGSAFAASGTVAVILVVVFIIVVLVIGAVGWLYYAYKNPTTRSGQWLIKHRPSEWKFSFSRGADNSADKYRVDMQTGQSTA